MIRLVALILVGIAVPLIAMTLQRRWKRLHSLGQGLIISYITVLLAFGVAEIYFRNFYADSAGATAASNWGKRYWHLNTQGFRDRDWTPSDWAGKTTIAMAGDSFTAGWGLINPADRFSDVLAGHLGEHYAVFNLGIAGAGPPEELASLHKSPDPSPDVVILQYFLNDIDSAVFAAGLSYPLPPTPFLATRSALASYIYTQFDTSQYNTYWQAAYASYDDDAIWSIQKRQIDDLIDYVDSTGARLIVVIFPNLVDPIGSSPYVEKVAQAIEATGHHDILKLTDEAAAWSPQARVVSMRDTHPSAAFDHRVGDLLYAQFFS